MQSSEKYMSPDAQFSHAHMVRFDRLLPGPIEQVWAALTDTVRLPAWYGMLVPAGTPREVVARLNAETVKALKDPQVDKALRAGRIFPIGNTPEEFGAMMRAGNAAWGRVIRDTGVKGE